MQEQYDAMKASVHSSDIMAFSVMQNTPIETVKSILGRINIEYREGLVKEAYLSAFKEEFYTNSNWIVQMLPGELLDFLMEVWEHEEEEIYMDADNWDYLQYLKIFGLLTYKKGNPITNEANTIYIIEEAKDTFYFFLKSKKSKKMVCQYEKWDKIISGFMYYYGLVDLQLLYNQFLAVSKTVLPYPDFLSYVKARCSMWAFGAILKDNSGKHEYFQYTNVDNPEIMLLYIREHADLPYKQIGEESLIYISEAGGIDNRWPGVSELGNLFINTMNMDYYRATVLVKTLIVMIQNSEEYNALEEKLDVLSFESSDMKKKVMESVRLLYENVPIYEYKGYSRTEYNRLFRKKQQKMISERFTLIKGGKDQGSDKPL